MENQIKCPECKSYRIEEKDTSKALSFIGMFFMVIGIVLVMLSPAVGLFILLVGLIMLTKGIFTPSKRECRCLNCGYKFIRKEDEAPLEKPEVLIADDSKYENNNNDFEKSVEQLNQTIINSRDSSSVEGKRIIKQSNNKTVNRLIYIMCLIFLGIFALSLILMHWYYIFLILLIWWVWKKTNLNKKTKSIVICFLIVLVMSAVSYFSYSDRKVTIETLSPEDGFSVQSNKTLIRGTIDPSNAVIKINNISIPVNDGSFEYEAYLPNEENIFTIYAINNEMESTAISRTIKIKRIFESITKTEEVKIKEDEVDINAVDSYGRTALIVATETNGNIDELIKNGSDINAKDGDNMTALMYAAQNGSIANIKKLIAAGADVNEVDISGLTALMYASIEGADNVVKELINNGANVNIKDYIGWTALKYASNDSFHPEIIKALKAAGAK
jgi:hypothetical protein